MLSCLDQGLDIDQVQLIVRALCCPVQLCVLLC